MTLSSVTEQSILERVDEYSLYCFYLESQPAIGGIYHSKIRKDVYPSFGIFELTRRPTRAVEYFTQFAWKDNGVGKIGDIFDLVQILCTLPTRTDAMFKIATDMGLLEGTIPVTKLEIVEPTRTTVCRIRVETQEFTPQDISYWNQFNISEQILKEYNCRRVKYYFLNEYQPCPYAPKQMYSYRIHDRYQLYQPFEEKSKKFRNDWTEIHIPGITQLQRRDLCIVTKAYKDVMSLRSFGFDAVSPRGENIPLSSRAIEYLQKRYSKVVVLFDNDGKHSAHLYPFPAIEVPIESETKDITDYCKKYGPAETLKLLNKLLYGNF